MMKIQISAGRNYMEMNKELSLTQEWDKTFKKSDKVEHSKVAFTNRYEIRSAVLIVHGEKAHSAYFGKDAYADMTKNSKYTENKELCLIPGAVHTDLYDNKSVIPFDKLNTFFKEYLI